MLSAIRPDERLFKALALGWHHHGIPTSLGSVVGRRRRAPRPERPRYVESGSGNKGTAPPPYQFVA